MIRVCKKGGYVIFDAHTEEALSENVLRDENNYVNEWRILPSKIIKSIFKERGMKLIHNFSNLMIGGQKDKPQFNIIESWYIYQKEDYS